MSWSVGASDATPKVGEMIENQFESGSKCIEPEESIRQSARKLIAEVVASQTSGTKLSINAYGSQSTNWPLPAPSVSTSLAIKIDVEA